MQSKKLASTPLLLAGSSVKLDNKSDALPVNIGLRRKKQTTTKFDMNIFHYWTMLDDVVARHLVKWHSEPLSTQTSHSLFRGIFFCNHICPDDVHFWWCLIFDIITTIMIIVSVPVVNKQTTEFIKLWLLLSRNCTWKIYFTQFLYFWHILNGID